MVDGAEGSRCWVDVVPQKRLTQGITLQPRVFNQFGSVTTMDALAYFGPHEVGLWPRWVYWYRNIGTSNTALIQVEFSPDAINWYVFGSQTLAPGVIDWAFITAPVARYVRLGYRSDSAGQPTSLLLWVQAQIP